MKRKQAATGKARISTAKLLNAISAASGDGVAAAAGQGVCGLRRKLVALLREYLPQVALNRYAPLLGENVVECATESDADATGDKTLLAYAHRFLRGGFSERELNAIGVKTVYKLMSQFYGFWEMSEIENACFSAFEYPDLRAVLEARKQHGRVDVCGEGVDVAVRLWELEDGLPLARDERERAEVQQEIDEYKKRLRALGEEIYETLKRAERKAAAAGSQAVDFVESAKGAIISYGAPDMKQMQRERAAQWLTNEHAEGRKASVVDAARQFGNEIEAEKIKGGYSSQGSLITALNKQADELGISKYIERRGKQKKGRRHEKQRSDGGCKANCNAGGR